MIDTQKRNELGRLAYTVVKNTRARYRSRLDQAGDRELYSWSTDLAAKEFWYQCLIRGYDTVIDVHNNVSVDLKKVEAA